MSEFTGSQVLAVVILTAIVSFAIGFLIGLSMDEDPDDFDGPDLAPA